MFKFKREYTVWWPVKVNVPADGGKTERLSFEAQFLILPADKTANAVTSAAGSDEELLRQVLADWRDVEDADGTRLDFTNEIRDRMIQVPFIRAALVRAYFEAAQGGRQKN